MILGRTVEEDRIGRNPPLSGPFPFIALPRVGFKSTGSRRRQGGGALHQTPRFHPLLLPLSLRTSETSSCVEMSARTEGTSKGDFLVRSGVSAKVVPSLRRIRTFPVASAWSRTLLRRCLASEFVYTSILDLQSRYFTRSGPRAMRPGRGACPCFPPFQG
jgi:hypothetical protein